MYVQKWGLLGPTSTMHGWLRRKPRMRHDTRQLSVIDRHPEVSKFLMISTFGITFVAYKRSPWAPKGPKGPEGPLPPPPLGA